jgi:STE24 endopeptidase
VLLAQLAPLLIPLFFKLKPMATSPLKEKLLSLCAGQGVKVEEVFHLGLGEKTEKGNAAFVGLGRTKKILIGDTLYEKYPEEQIEAVFAHELGHQVHNDIWKNIILSGLLTFVVFYVANALCQAWAFTYFDTSIDRPFGLFVFFALFSVCQFPTGLLMTAFSRQRERAADKFADNLNRSKPLAEALEALTIQNKGLFHPNPIVEFFKYSHPAPWRRIHPRLYPS